MAIGLVLLAQAQAPVAATHFYADWTFWQGFVAVLALILSQLPPLVTFLRPGRLKVDFPSKIFVTHIFGNANINLLVGLRNVGAREVRVRAISMLLKRADGEPFRLDAHQFENPGDSKLYFLVPFSIRPHENWVRLYLFYRDLDRQTDKEIRANKLAVSRQIRERRVPLGPNSPEIVQVDDALAAPFRTLFDKQFRWFPGEYEVELSIATEPTSAVLRKSFRFVLFEGDSDQLRDHVLEYSTGGGGIQWSGERALVGAGMLDCQPRRPTSSILVPPTNEFKYIRLIL